MFIEAGKEREKARKGGKEGGEVDGGKGKGGVKC